MPPKRDGVIIIHALVRKEIEMLNRLAPLRAAPLNLPTSCIIITFDTSLIGGAVMFATIELLKFLGLWERYQNNCTLHQNEGSNPPQLDEFLRKIYIKANWELACAMKWKRKYQINVLQSATALIALEYLARKKRRTRKFFSLWI
eukprot:gb/GEZJ01008138.1/.p1 GENE.gb/GEZJ01008138.1/~~gb/GEZJ01008138.1/.p1  ORF type:complete len:164 (-),score=13.40 gb/GEZJ01008138.1/:146-580(-)